MDKQASAQWVEQGRLDGCVDSLNSEDERSYKMSNKVKLVMKDAKGQDILENPFRLGTSKRALIDWAMDKGEFTKAEFLEAAKELHAQGKVVSKMPVDIMNRAWWNEFYNKFDLFVPVSDEKSE